MRINAIRFRVVPPVGTEFEMSGKQVFSAVGSKPHVTNDGRTVELIVWETICPTSGEKFQVMTPLLVRDIARRAAGYRTPGKRVKTKAKKRAANGAETVGAASL